jgi:hypothetical protein
MKKVKFSKFLPYSKVAPIQRNNLAYRWHKPGTDADEVGGQMAFQRLGREFFQPSVHPSFKIPRDSNFFMMGSCFARGLENALSNQGLRVLSLSRKFDAFNSTEKTQPLGVTNRYNTASMLNEFRWALDPNSPFPQEAIIDLGDGTAIDPHMNPVLDLADRATTLRRREIFSEVVAELVNVDMLVLTLGLTEVWTDRQLGLAMNVAPILPMIRTAPDRFVYRRQRYAESLHNLNEIHRLMRTYGKPGHKIVVTVSPVPLIATFTTEDVVVANTYSKSVLRAVATDFAEAHANVDYFPSYEIVMNSKFETSWTEDKRHPQGKLAGHIMRTFVRNYCLDVDAGDVEATTKREFELIAL